VSDQLLLKNCPFSVEEYIVISFDKNHNYLCVAQNKFEYYEEEDYFIRIATKSSISCIKS
jgi:hypothetical protein